MTITSIRHLVASALAIVLLIPGFVSAQQAVTRVEGFIQDEISGGPVGCKMYVYNEAGKRVRSLRSNSGDGSYLAVVNHAGKHKFVLAGHNVYRKEFYVDIPASTKFQDVKQNFTVKLFREGHELYSGEAFLLNSYELTEEAKAELKVLHEAVTVNQQLNLVVSVTADQDQIAKVQTDSVTKYLKDSIAWAKAMKKYERKYRRRKKKPEPPVAPVRPVISEDPNVELLKNRTLAVEEFFDNVRNAEMRIKITATDLDASLVKEGPNEEEILKALTAKKKKKKKKSKKKTSEEPAQVAVGHPTLVVKIGAVKRLFD